MKLMKGFMVFLGLFLVFIGFMLGIGPLENPTGQQYEVYQSMLVSGTSVASHPILKWMALFFGVGILIVFGVFMSLGFRKAEKKLNAKLKQHLFVGMGLYIASFIVMTMVYWQYHNGDNFGYFLGVPSPTAWMLFGLGLTPLYFTIIYIIKFNDWIISPEELDEFQEIVRKRKQREEESTNY
ncbi:MAG: hypothetical protein MK226_20825 [Saprospiraceae bacterium]|nr:hypothetical protein [Saprospiraceae bacterium]